MELPDVEFLISPEAARLFGVTPATVTRWARLGYLVSYRRPDGKHLFPVAQPLIQQRLAQLRLEETQNK